MKKILVPSVALGLVLAGCATRIPAWNAASRAETAAWFAENEYGVLPPGAEKPDVRFAPIGEDRVMMEGRALRKRVRVTVTGPCGSHSFALTAFIPTAAKGPVPSFLFICNRPPAENIDPERIVKSPFWPAEEIVGRGYAAIAFSSGEVTPDWDTGGLAGIFSCYLKTESYSRKPNHWGTLRAWAFGASRAMDWIETEPLLDPRHVAVVGHSRGGKTALVAGVNDPRFAMACVNDSGCSGMKLNRMDLPDSEQTSFMSVVLGYWFCNNYRKWAYDPVKAAPFDQHQYAALMAPRLLAVASASEDAWAGPRGEFEACRLASGAWEAWGLKGLVADGFPSEPDAAFQDGSIGYHLRKGEHNLKPQDWARFMDFADRHGWRGAASDIPRAWRTYLEPPAAYAAFARTVEKKATCDCGDFTVEVYEQANGPVTRQRVMMAVPKYCAGKCPAVVVPYYFPEGMLGFDPKDPSATRVPEGGPTALDSYRPVAFLSGLVRRGYIAVSADAYHLTYGRATAPADVWQKWKHAGTELARDWPDWTGIGKLAFDTRLLVDLVAADPRVDAGRIGLIGHSLGGKMAFYAGCLDPRVKAIVASDFGIGWDQSNWSDVWYWGDRLESARAAGLDNADLLKLAKDRSFMLIAGEYDNAESLRSMERAAGGPIPSDRWVFLNHATGHRPPPDAVEAAYRFLDGHLRD